jgi:hypothetical protein
MSGRPTDGCDGRSEGIRLSLPTLALALSLMVAGSAPGPVSAQEEPPPTGGQLINYVYASVLGSGIYSAAGRSVRVYRLPISVPVRSAEKQGFGFRLKFPVGFGFYDFKVSDIIEGDFPEDVQTVSFVPGVEFDIPLRHNWSLFPFADLGIGKDVAGGESTWLFSAGLRSRATFLVKGFELTLGNSLLWAGHTNFDGEPAEGLSVFETGLDVRHPLGIDVAGRPASLSVYGATYLYLNGIEFFRFEQESLTLDEEYEIGVTFGRDKPWSWWFINIPRVGVGYRFGPGFSAVRILFGDPF